MDAEDKLTALKKAYADIILNTSKEAAARVMSSERRAARYQKELKVAKEESLRMMLRLKQMMDSKMGEAEVASLNQQNKIEELEAQLHEAEDIVKDLRQELEEVQVELERVKKHNFQHANKSSNTCSRELETRNNSCQSTKFLHPNSQDEFSMASVARVPHPRNESCKCNSNVPCTCCSYMGNRDLPSIILRGKEPSQYRNGCTQRILACERNLLDKELCLSVETDKVKENNSREQEEGEDACTEPHSGAKNLSELEKKLLADIKHNNFQFFPRRRKRTARLRKTLVPLSGELLDQFQNLELSSRHIPVSAKDSARSCEKPSEVTPISSPTSTHLGCIESSKTGTNTVENLDCKMKENTVCLGKETGSPECEAEVEKDDLPSNCLDRISSYRTEELASKSVGARVIKYTFQRKRKRVSLSGSEVKSSFGTETKTEDKQSGDQNLEQSKTSALESSRDSRRLAQVARQLISLSEKKWWH